MNTATNNR